MVGHAAAVREWNPVRESCDKTIVYTIQSVVIRSDMRNQGLGKDLMQQVEKTVIAAHPNKPAVRLVLEADKNSRLPEFYNRLGYTLVDNRSPESQSSPVRSQRAAGEEAAEPSLRPPPSPPPPLIVPLTSGTSDKVMLHKIVTCVCDES